MFHQFIFSIGYERYTRVYTHLIVINVSLMVSRTVWAWVCDMRLKFLTSCLRSFAFFCRPLSWLYISGVSARSLYTYWPVTSAAGFGGGVGLCLSLSVIVHSARKGAYLPRDHPRIARTLKGFKLARGAALSLVRKAPLNSI